MGPSDFQGTSVSSADLYQTKSENVDFLILSCEAICKTNIYEGTKRLRFISGPDLSLNYTLRQEAHGQR